MQNNKQSGFTIFELMIATVVFGSLLAMLTATMIAMSNQFYRGVNTSKTQQVSRTIANQIARTIQLSAGDVIKTNPTSTTAGVICFGSTQGFHYILGTKDTELQRTTAFTNDCTARSKTGFSGDNEFLALGMRLSNLDIQQSGNLYIITITVAYGDDDLLNTAPPNSVTSPKCNPGAGSQFCSVVTVKQTVSKRF